MDSNSGLGGFFLIAVVAGLILLFVLGKRRSDNRFEDARRRLGFSEADYKSLWKGQSRHKIFRTTELFNRGGECDPILLGTVDNWKVMICPFRHMIRKDFHTFEFFARLVVTFEADRDDFFLPYFQLLSKHDKKHARQIEILQWLHVLFAPSLRSSRDPRYYARSTDQSTSGAVSLLSSSGVQRCLQNLTEDWCVEGYSNWLVIWRSEKYPRVPDEVLDYLAQAKSIANAFKNAIVTGPGLNSRETLLDVAEKEQASGSSLVLEPRTQNFKTLLKPPPPLVTPPARRDAPRIGRNDPCPCGSGKKYKKCCGTQISKSQSGPESPN
jgi:hypothetical protein